MQDVTYTELIILEYRDRTELADGKHDGKINMQDVTQIELVILGKEKEITIVDATGDAVTINKPVERILVMFKNHLDIVQILDVEDSVVAVCEWAKENPEAHPGLSELPSVGHWYRPDYEAVLTVNPDLIIPLVGIEDGKVAAWSMGKIDAIRDNVPSAVVLVLPLDQDRSGGASFVENFRTLGYILSRVDEADEFVDWYEGVIESIESETGALSEGEKTSYFMMHGHDYTYPYPYMSSVTGGRNIVPTHGTIDVEWIIDQNPEVIIREAYQAVPCQGYSCDDPSAMASVREEIMNRAEFAEVTAVTTGRVYVLAAENMLCGPCHILTIPYMAKWFHPELFEDLDPQAIHQEYITRFKRMDYDLEEHGVFVCPGDE